MTSSLFLVGLQPKVTSKHKKPHQYITETNDHIFQSLIHWFACVKQNLVSLDHIYIIFSTLKQSHSVHIDIINTRLMHLTVTHYLGDIMIIMHQSPCDSTNTYRDILYITVWHNWHLNVPLK